MQNEPEIVRLVACRDLPDAFVKQDLDLFTFRLRKLVSALMPKKAVRYFHSPAYPTSDSCLFVPDSAAS